MTVDTYKRQRLIWKVLYHPVRLFAKIVFRYSYEPIQQEDPFLLVANHVTAFDFMFISLANRGRPIHIMSTAQLTRGWAGRLLQWLASPIPRQKGTAAYGTVKQCLKTFREGRSVCIFGEGNLSWDGRSVPVVGGTASLVQAAKVPLVTYRTEGGYLSKPCWGRGIRKGRIQGRVTGVYTAEELEKLSKEEVLRLMNQGIDENAWERQKKDRVRYKSRHAAEYLEKLLYLCPQCSRIGTLKSKGDRLFCDCGLNLRYTETGFFEPEKPFSNLAEWEDWQREQLHQGHFEQNSADGRLFSDDGVILSLVGKDNEARVIGTGTIIQYEDRLECVGMRFDMADISDMNRSRAHVLMFSAGEGYYQIHVKGPINLHKYHEFWKGIHDYNG